jgi:hypothetical protein
MHGSRTPRALREGSNGRQAGVDQPAGRNAQPNKTDGGRSEDTNQTPAYLPAGPRSWVQILTGRFDRIVPAVSVLPMKGEVR